MDKPTELEEIDKIKRNLKLQKSLPVEFDSTNRQWITEQARRYGVSEEEFVITLLDAVRCADHVRKYFSDIRGLEA